MKAKLVRLSAIPIVIVLAVTLITCPATAGQDIWTTRTLFGYQVTGLAIDPQSPNTLYVGTREGILKSVDGGTLWSSVKGPLGTIHAIAVHPQASGTLYVCVNGLLYKTTDGGDQWAQLGQGLVEGAHLIVLDPQDPDTLYVSSSAGVFRTDDGGESWAGAGVPAQGGASVIAIDPQNTDIVYASIRPQGLLKSIDGSQSWTATGTGLPAREPPTSLVIHPQDTHLLYAVVRGQIYKSTDHGDNWATIPLPDQQVYSVFIHPDRLKRLYATGSRQGLFFTADDGANWKPVGAGLPERLQSPRLMGDPQDPEVFYAITNEQLYRSADSAQNWTIATLPGLITKLVAHPTSPQALCMEVHQVGVYQSTDGGEVWVAMEAQASDPASMFCPTFDLRNPEIMYAGAGNQLHRSTDAGEEWHSLNLPPNARVLGLTTDPTDDGIIYVVSTGGVLKSTNGGESWTLSSLPVDVDTEVSIAVMPETPATLYVGGQTRGYPFLVKSTDGGLNWESLTRFDSGGTGVVFHPRDPSTILTLVYDKGVAVSIDGGSNWEYKSAGLPQRIQPLHLAVHSTKNTYFLTTSQGMFVSTDLDTGWAPLEKGFLPVIDNRLVHAPLRGLAVTAGDPPQLFVHDGRGTLWQYTMNTAPQPPAPTPSPSPTQTATRPPTSTPPPSPTPSATWTLAATRAIQPTLTATKVAQRVTLTSTETPKSTAQKTPESVAQATPTKTREQPTATTEPQATEKPSRLRWILGGAICLVVGVAVVVVIIVLLRRRKGKGSACPKCGAKTPPGSAFCTSCGAKLGEE